MSDLRDMGVGVDWYCLCQNRKNWAELSDEQIVRRKKSSICAANQGASDLEFTVLVEGPFTGGVT